MHLYLRHPVHGTKVAINELEADLDQQNGWVRYDPVSDPAVSASPAVIDTNGLELKRRRRVPHAPEV